MAGTITAANAALLVTIEALYPAAQRLQGFAADDIFDTEAVENGEYLMGVDGKLSAGFVFNALPWTVMLQADSPSVSLFEQVWQYETANRTKLTVQITATLPALSKRYELKTGFMRSYKAPAGKKVLQPAAVHFVFSRMEISPT